MSLVRQFLVIYVFFAGFLVGAFTHAEEEKVLNIYNFNDYIGPDTVKDFEKETGIHVNYDFYDSNQMLDAKLSTGRSGYDIIVPSLSPWLERMMIAHSVAKLDKSLLPNLSNLDPVILEKARVSDPGNDYAIPYMWGTTGIGYNPDMVKKALGEKAPTNSLALLFDPENAKKLKSCGISLLDDAPKVLGAALAYLHLDPTSKDLNDIKRASEVVKRIMPFVRKLTQTLYIDMLATGDLCVAYGHNGDVTIARDRAREARNGVRLEYVIPKEKALFWIDTMAIPRDAPHIQNAHKFLNFIMRPDVAAKISDNVTYANANREATRFVSEKLVSNPAIYPDEDTIVNHTYSDQFRLTSSGTEMSEEEKAALRKFERVRNLEWMKIKAGEIK